MCLSSLFPKIAELLAEDFEDRSGSGLRALSRVFVSIRVHSWLNVPVKAAIPITVDAEPLTITDRYPCECQLRARSSGLHQSLPGDLGVVLSVGLKHPTAARCPHAARTPPMVSTTILRWGKSPSLLFAIFVTPS